MLYSDQARATRSMDLLHYSVDSHSCNLSPVTGDSRSKYISTGANRGAVRPEVLIQLWTFQVVLADDLNNWIDGVGSLLFHSYVEAVSTQNISTVTD